MENVQKPDSSVDESGTKLPAGGPEGEPKQTPIKIPDDTPIPYSAYQKLLAEKRKLKDQHTMTVSELAVYQARDKEKAEQQLIADREFDKVLAERETAIKELKDKLDLSSKNELDYRKMHSFTAGLGQNQIDPKYFPLVPLEDIELNEYGEIDPASLAKVVKDFKAEHPRLLVESKTPLPSRKVGGSKTGGLTHAEWKLLGTSKEQKERYSDIVWDKDR